MTRELVVLVDAQGRAVGAVPKDGVHHGETPLHLAFSLYVFNAGGELLLTRRAETKATFPGVWTNSVCGHPGPGEPLDGAARRRAAAELGLEVGPTVLALPDFSYRAEMLGVVEHELCPVLTTRVASDVVLSPEPAEVAQTAWVPWARVVEDVRAGRMPFSPWGVEQVRALDDLGPDPAAWPPADPRRLPPAARSG